MSESEIKALCEQYINRPFDEEDLQSLRSFLRDLMKQKVSKPISSSPTVPAVERTTVVVPKDDIAPLSAIVSKNAPITQKVEGFVRAVSTTTVEKTSIVDVGNVQKVAERKDAYTKVTGDTPAETSDPRSVEERVKEAKAGPPMKDRLTNLSQVLQTGSQVVTAAPEKVEERLAEVKGAAPVSARLGNWAKVVSENESKVLTSTSDPSLIEDRLGEEFTKTNIGMKDRLGNWQAPAVVPVATSDPETLQERLAEAKGSAVRERLNTWGKVINEGEKTPSTSSAFVEERLAEVKGAVGIKDRLEVFKEVQSESTKVIAADPSKVEERLAEVKGAVGVKDRLVVLKEVVSEAEKVITADPEVIQERLSGVPRSTSVRERQDRWVNQQQQQQSTPVSERKQPIELPTEEVTKDQQGQ